MTETPLFDQVLRYDGAAIMKGRRRRPVPCALQPRDVGLLQMVARCKFLTTPQILEVWWPGGVPQVGRRRLAKLFEGGFLDRFRPVALRGSFPWTYQLGRAGHQVLQRAGMLGRGERFETSDVYDYRYVLHNVHLTSWVIAWRRLLDSRLLEWLGETQADAPRDGLAALGVGAAGLRDPRARPIRPDAVLEVAARDPGTAHTFLIEYDRTRRVDKNFDKFQRYDTFLSTWWTESPFGAGQRRPWVIFVCQSAEQRELFLRHADRHVTGSIVVSDARDDTGVVQFPGRQRMLFVNERDVHERDLTAWALPSHPPTSERREPRDATHHRVRLPSSPLCSVDGGSTA